jgi:hypothetical protein
MIQTLDYSFANIMKKSFKKFGDSKKGSTFAIPMKNGAAFRAV